MDCDSGSKYITFHKGKKVFKEGQQGSVAYMLKKGRVTLSRTLKNKRVVLAHIQPGQVFGEEGLLKGEKRIADAVVDEPSELIVIDKTVFQSMLIKSPAPIRRLTRYLIDQVKNAHFSIREQNTGNVFMSVCTILEMSYRAHMGRPKSARGKGWDLGLSYAEVSKCIKDILLVNQIEIDDIINRLAKLKIVDVSESREAVVKPDALGRMRRTTDFLKDRFVNIRDLSNFMSVARGLSQEMESKPPFTDCLEFIGIHEFADAMGADPEIIYKKMSYKEIPETYYFFHKPTVMAWAKEKGEEFFKRVKRKRIKVEDLETVDDVVHVDNATLQDAFTRLGFHKLAVLVSMAGEEARARILANLSKKTAKMVQDQAMEIENLDDMEAADIEDELIGTIKQIKGLGK